MDELYVKKMKLEGYLKDLGSLAVAFSSGVDSTFLLKTAKDVLRDNVIAVTVRSHSFPAREADEAAAFCEKEGIRQVFADIEPLLYGVERDDPAYAEARRLLKFLSYFLPVPPDVVPLSSIAREFIGGSCYNV